MWIRNPQPDVHPTPVAMHRAWRVRRRGDVPYARSSGFRRLGFDLHLATTPTDRGSTRANDPRNVPPPHGAAISRFPAEYQGCRRSAYTGIGENTRAIRFREGAPAC